MSLSHPHFFLSSKDKKQKENDQFLWIQIARRIIFFSCRSSESFLMRLYQVFVLSISKRISSFPVIWQTRAEGEVKERKTIYQQFGCVNNSCKKEIEKEKMREKRFLPDEKKVNVCLPPQERREEQILFRKAIHQQHNKRRRRGREREKCSLT